MSPPPSSRPDLPALQEHHSAPRLFARNRRDGARLLSSSLTITVIGLVGWGHPIGRGVALVSGAVSLYWWLQYRRLSQ